MHKRLIKACMAVAAFAAFAAPAASAANLKEAEVTIAPGASITAKGSGATLFTAGGITFECTSTHASGTVTADAGGTIAGEIPVGGVVLKGTGAGEDCTSGLGPFKPTMVSKLCLHLGPGTDAGTMTGCGGSITFSLVVTSLLTCKYTTASISGSITTAPKDAEINGREQPVIEVEPKFLCPDTAEIDSEWVLTTTDGTTLQFTT